MRQKRCNTVPLTSTFLKRAAASEGGKAGFAAFLRSFCRKLIIQRFLGQDFKQQTEHIVGKGKISSFLNVAGS